MKTKLLILGWLIIGVSCICGMCSKDNAGSGGNNGNGNAVPPPDATKAYVSGNF